MVDGRKYKKIVTPLNSMATLTAVIHKEEDMFVASCPETGTVSQGDTVEASLKNLQEATVLFLEEFPTRKFSKPIIATFEVLESEKA